MNHRVKTEIFTQTHKKPNHLDNGQLGGGNVKGVDIRSQAGESLLGTIGPLRQSVGKFHETNSGGN